MHSLCLHPSTLECLRSSTIQPPLLSTTNIIQLYLIILQLPTVMDNLVPALHSALLLSTATSDTNPHQVLCPMVLCQLPNLLTNQRQNNVPVANVVDVSSSHLSTTAPRTRLLHRLQSLPNPKTQCFLSPPTPNTTQPFRRLPLVLLQHPLWLQARVLRTATTRHGPRSSHLVLPLKPELGHRSTTINMMTLIEPSSNIATMPTLWSWQAST